MRRGELRTRVLEAVAAQSWPTTEEVAAWCGLGGTMYVGDEPRLLPCLEAAWELGELAHVGRRWSVSAIPQDVAGIEALAGEWSRARDPAAVLVARAGGGEWVIVVRDGHAITDLNAAAHRTEWAAWRAALEVLS